MTSYKNNSNIRERKFFSGRNFPSTPLRVEHSSSKNFIHSPLEASGLWWNHSFILAVSIGIVFFIFAFFTMPDYNIMWDGRNHFFKGQAFAHFFLTGKRDYKDLPITKEFARYYRDYAKSFTPNLNIEERLSKDPQFRRSIYKDEVHTFGWLMKRPPTEHPVLSDIGSSFFNILFYEKLGWLRDDHAYHLYSIVLSSVLVGVVFYWMSTAYGLFSAIITTLTLATTPLFWAESHYNIKDIPVLVFFSLAIYTFWKGTITRSKKWIIGSAFLAGLALGTKFNTLFLPFVLVPWFVIHYVTQAKKKRLVYHKWWWLVFIYPVIMFGVLYIGWPQLWNNPISGFINVINYYRSVGVNIDYTPTFRTVFGLSTYPSFWIFVTTYPVAILLAGIGFVASVFRVKKTKDILPLLFILWLFVPIARSSLPNTSIFGGVRHIIEYIPAMAMLAGYGTYEIVKLLNCYIAGRFRQFSFIQILILITFIPFIVTLTHLHPAENVYFNSFIGGLSGAKKANLTGWGNTDGGIYKKALIWLNKHAEKHAHIAVGFSETADFYIPEFREDLLADNQFSGYLQKGEYIIALTHNSELEHTYRMLYPETFLVPLYEYKVDGVPLIKIWKNDKTYVKPDFYSLRENTVIINPQKKVDGLYWDLGSVKLLTRIELTFDESVLCKDLNLGYLQISKDGDKWKQLPETYPGQPIETLGLQPNNNRMILPIANQFARYLLFTIEPENACLFNVKRSRIVTVE